MKVKNTKRFSKTLSKKALLLSWLSFLLIGLVYAGLFPSLPEHPEWMITNGSFFTRFTHMFVNCPANEFLKGFDADLNRICVASTGIYSWPAISPIPAPTSGGYPGSPAGQMTGGKFANYFRNLSGLCGGNTIVKGFATDGWKYCVNPATPSVVSNPHTPLAVPHVWPSTAPSGQSTDGKFQDLFTAMSTTCAGNQVVNGFGTDGSVVCGDLPPTNCTAGNYTHLTHSYSVPQFNNGFTGSVNSSPVAIPNGTQIFSLVYGCNNGIVSEYSTERANTPVCNTNYTWNGSSCIISSPSWVVLGTYYPGMSSLVFDSSSNSIWGTTYSQYDIWCWNYNLRKVRASDGVELINKFIGTSGCFGHNNAGDLMAPIASHSIAFDPSTNSVWVIGFASNTVVKYRALDGVKLGTYPVGTYPLWIIFDPSTNSIWVNSSYGTSNPTLVKLRASDGTRIGTYFPGIYTSNMTFDPSTNSIWFSSDSNTIVKMRASDGVILGNYFIGNYEGGISAIVADPSTSSIWVGFNDDWGSNLPIIKIRASDGIKLGTYLPGTYTSDMAFDSSTNSIWVSSWDLKKISTSNWGLLGTYTAPSNFNGNIIFDPSSSAVWLVDDYSWRNLPQIRLLKIATGG